MFVLAGVIVAVPVELALAEARDWSDGVHAARSSAAETRTRSDRSRRRRRAEVGFGGHELHGRRAAAGSSTALCTWQRRTPRPHRSRSRYATHAASSPNHALNSAHVRG